MRSVLTRPFLYVLPPPLDEIALANALVLKDPPLHLIGTDGMPNFIRCMHGDLEKQFGTAVMLPNLHNSHFVGVFSDYGGDETDSDYFTYSFLIISLDSVKPCLDALEQIREQHKLLFPRKEMAFKDLHYGPLERALPQWLNAIDSVPGLLFTLMIDKSFRSAVTRNSNEALRALADDMEAKDRGKWRKSHVAERFMRISHCVAYWCSILCRQGQHIIWITDNDPITKQSLALRQVTTSAMAGYRGLTGNFSMGSEAEIRDNFREYHDLLSYPDLVAGSLSNGVSQAAPVQDIIGSHPVPMTTKPKALPILRWLAGQRIGLKRALFICRVEGNMLRGSFGTLDHDVIPDGMRFIPITPPG